jgi:CDP-diacylglycerol--glycerol-3-phosphate 3-phosphatidyltransferase
VSPSRIAILAHVLAAAASAVAFVAIRPAGRERVAGRWAPFRGVANWVYWLTGPVVRGAVPAGIPASAFTVLGMLLSAAAGVLASQDGWTVAGLVLVWASLCDLLDGEVARAAGSAGPAGAFLDSTLDRFGETALFVGIAAGLPDRLGMVAACGALGGSLLVSYARARGEGCGVDCPPGGLERPHRLAILIVALLLAELALPDRPDRVIEVACALVAAGALLTAAGRTLVIHRRLRRPGPREEERPALRSVK